MVFVNLLGLMTIISISRKKGFYLTGVIKFLSVLYFIYVHKII